MNEALCTFCQNIFQGDVPHWTQAYCEGSYVCYDSDHSEGSLMSDRPLREEGGHHNSVAELRDCGLHSCRLCALLWTSISERMQTSWLEADASIGLQSSQGSSTLLEGVAAQIQYRIQLSQYNSELDIEFESATSPKNDLHGMKAFFRPYSKIENLDLTALKPRGLIDCTSSPECIAQISHWLRICRRTHWKCRESYDKSWLPSRLLHVGRESDNLSPSLHHRSSIVGPASYATLSHCWGAKGTLQLTIARLSAFSSGIQLSDFPATYRDAIVLTRALGIQYIWIDSMCIIQDSQDDWRTECMAMADVYKNGIFNIAALHAKDGNGGCFALRDSNLFKPLVVRSSWPNFADNMWLLWPTKCHDDTDSPLLKRGWVLQESILSPRVVRFGKQTLGWLCREQSSSESAVSGVRARARSTLYEGLTYRNQQDLYRRDGLLMYWNEVVADYSNASLSHAEDKLVAFSGIAKICQKVLERTSSSEWTYLAGLWLPHLPFQMLWTRVYWTDPGVGRAQATRPSKYRAPSWSWAAIDGSTYFLDWPSYITQKATQVFLQIFDAHVEPAGFDPFLQVASGYLRLRCFLFRLDQAYPREPYYSERRTEINWDVEDLAEDPDELIYLMPIMIFFDNYDTSDDDLGPLRVALKGLILHQVGDRFWRTGIFQLKFEKHAEAFDGLKDSDGVSWMRAIVSTLHERGSLASYFFKSQFPVVDNDNDAKHLWARHDIYLI